jgi:hypothetical protein
MFFIVLCVVSVLCCLLHTFVQVYRPLPQGGKTIAVNKDHHHHHVQFIQLAQGVIWRPALE